MREQQIEQAKKALKELDVLGKVRKEFSNGHVWLSEDLGGPFGATLYDIDQNCNPDQSEDENRYNKIKRLINEFEGHNNAVVYHVIIDANRWINLLYVSQYEADWVLDDEQRSEGRVLAYVISDCPEAGIIGVKPMYGGLKRVW